MKVLKILIVTLICLAGLVTLAVYGYQWRLSQPLLIESESMADIPRGSSLNGFLNRLQRDGLLGQGHAGTIGRYTARIYAQQIGLDNRLPAGEYRIYADDTLRMMLDRVAAGEVIQRSITFVEGWTFRQWREHLANNEHLLHTLSEQTDADIMSSLDREGVHPEGWFAPETYVFERGTTDIAVLRRALHRQEALLEAAWQQRQPSLPLNDAYEALILASIIERETGAGHERQKIAGVFVNRLRLGMRLQTDPTVIYGMGERYDGRIRRSDLREATPYNTYVIPALPPTPIAMPGHAAIQAAVDPLETDKLYFVAKGDGTHQFSRTLRDHNAAVRRYQLQRRADYRSSPAPQVVP